MLIVRPMQFSDVEQVYQIELMAHRAPWSREILRDCVLVGYDCRVLEQQPKVILGYIISRFYQDTYHILNLCIDCTQQGQGFGKQLLESVLNSLDPRLVKNILLEVRPSNVAAIALYKKFGFEQEMVKKDYYQDQTGLEDALLLKKVLSASDFS